MSDDKPLDNKASEEQQSEETKLDENPLVPPATLKSGGDVIKKGADITEKINEKSVEIAEQLNEQFGRLVEDTSANARTTAAKLTDIDANAAAQTVANNTQAAAKISDNFEKAEKILSPESIAKGEAVRADPSSINTQEGLVRLTS